MVVILRHKRDRRILTILLYGAQIEERLSVIKTLCDPFPPIWVNLKCKLGGEVHVTSANTGRFKNFVTVLWLWLCLNMKHEYACYHRGKTRCVYLHKAGIVNLLYNDNLELSRFCSR